MDRVSLIKGQSPRDAVRKSLEVISDEIRDSMASRTVVIKPNFVSSTIALASSNADQMRGILDFLRQSHAGRVIIAEASAEDTRTAFRNFAYQALLDEYDVELADLNDGPFETLHIRNRLGHTVAVRVAALLLDGGNYVVSAARLKTHDSVVVALSIKNLVMGGIHRDDKALVHQGCKMINRNIAELAGRLWPDLSVIDGIRGMEGDGPTRGSPMQSGVVISSTDALAADRVACSVMGVDFSKVGYLVHCAESGFGEADLKNIKIAGEPLRECIRPFRLHSTVETQYRWR